MRKLQRDFVFLDIVCTLLSPNSLYPVYETAGIDLSLCLHHLENISANFQRFARNSQDNKNVFYLHRLPMSMPEACIGTGGPGALTPLLAPAPPLLASSRQSPLEGWTRQAD